MFPASRSETIACVAAIYASFLEFLFDDFLTHQATIIFHAIFGSVTETVREY